MLGERVTTEISQKEKPDTFGKHKQVAKRGGNVAGVAREQTEKELGRSVISGQNFLLTSSTRHPTQINNTNNEGSTYPLYMIIGLLAFIGSEACKAQSGCHRS
jgi:hypothetical protein